MRVLYVTARYVSHDRRFLAACVGQGHQVWFCALETQVTDQDLLPAGVDIWPAVDPDALEQWSSLIAEHRIELIHAGPIPTVASRVAGRFDVPLVVMSWGSDILVDATEKAVFREAACAAIAAAHVIIGDCHAVIEKIYQWFPDLQTPYVEFPWGLELERFTTLPIVEAGSLRNELGWGNNVVLVSTRAWEPLYGIDKLIDAFGRAIAVQPSLRLILISDGSMRDLVKEKIRRLNLEDKICCPGRVEEADLPRWFCAADVYVSSATSDGTSISLLEAFACGLPVIVHDRYGNLEWVEHGVNGWLVDCRSPEQLAEAISLAIEKRSEWNTIGRINRRTAFAKADWNTNSKQLSVAYALAVATYGGHD